MEKPLVLTTTAFLSETQVVMDEVVLHFLEKSGLHSMVDTLQYCLRELGINAKKANVKRAYFQSIGLDIQKSEDYERGMLHFRSEALTHSRAFWTELRQSGYKIRIEMWKYKDICSIAVKNNVPMVPQEIHRVEEKIRNAKLYAESQSSLSELVDESEGAGLGILVLIQMLSKMGCTGEYFQVYAHKGQTVARIVLPLSLGLGHCNDG